MKEVSEQTSRTDCKPAAMSIDPIVRRSASWVTPRENPVTGSGEFSSAMFRVTGSPGSASVELLEKNTLYPSWALTDKVQSTEQRAARKSNRQGRNRNMVILPMSLGRPEWRSRGEQSSSSMIAPCGEEYRLYPTWERLSARKALTERRIPMRSAHKKTTLPANLAGGVVSRSWRTALEALTGSYSRRSQHWPGARTRGTGRAERVRSS